MCSQKKKKWPRESLVKECKVCLKNIVDMSLWTPVVGGDVTDFVPDSLRRELLETIGVSSEDINTFLTRDPPATFYS